MKRFLSILLSVAMVMTMMPIAFAESVSEDGWDFTAETVETADEAVQGTAAELSAADEVSYSKDGGSTWTNAAFDTVWSETAKSANWGNNYQIKVLKDFSLTADKEYSLSYGVKVTIFADADVTITVPTTTKITVSSGGQYNKGDAILTFGKSGATGTVTFDGGKETFSDAVFRTNWSSGSYMGHLVINDGASIKNFKRGSGGTYYGIIYNNGQLDINGGSITDNEISSSTVDSVIFNCRKLNIVGGEISNNSITSSNGYIVMVRGSSAEFTMTGGKIILNNVRKTVIQLAQDDSSYQGSATITEGTIANNKGYSYSDDDFTADAKDISIGTSLTKLTLNGTAEIGTIETNVKNINNSKFITIASGFAPATPISVLVAMSYIGGQVYPSEGMQVATVENGASINGKLVYYNTDFSISDNGKLAGPPEVEYSTDSGATWTSSSLSDAVTAIGADTGTIKVLRDVTVSAEIEIVGNITLVANNKDITITRADTLTGVPVISVASRATLNLGTKTPMVYTLTIDGGAVWNGNEGYPNTEADQWSDKSNNTGVRGNFAIIRTDGTFNMYENVILQNNHNNTSIYDNHSGGGVDIENTGVFNMYGGKIWKCSSASQAEWGGGVTVAGLDHELETPATFNMYGGEICYNTAGIGGGVSVGNPNGTHNHPAIFNMYNGNIHHNKAGSMDAYSGAGVYVADNAVFTMKDGSITENTAEAKNGYALGGGVESVGTFNMNGGTISGNTANNGGAGIFLMYNNNVDCTANITGGNIINNNGEGIFINDTKAYLNISGNVNISGNTTTGIYIEDGAAPINVDGALTAANAIDVNSAVTDDGTVIVTFADGLNASDYTSAFKHASKNLLVKENALVIGVQTYSVTITDPIYMTATYPGGTDSKIGTITVTGASDLAAVPEGTKLTLAITAADDTKAKNHTFVKWVVKTAGGEDVTVTDNKFTMPGEAVTVTAEYVPDIQMTFYAGPSADTTYECKNYTWNGDGTITYTMPGNKGTLTISTPNGFKLWQYIVDDETKTPTVTANDVVTVTVNTNEGYTFNGIKSVKSQMGSLTGTFSNSGTYTFSVPVGTFNNYKGTQNAYIILDITTNQYNITKNYNTDEGEVIVIDRFDSTHTSIDKAYYKENLWVSIEPKANYKIKSVSCKAGENDVSDFAQTSTTGKSYTFTMPASDVTINVEFELDACAITTDIKNGTISGITSPAAIGSDVSFTLAPQDDTYELGSYKVFKTGDENTTVTVTESNGTYTFTMPSYPVTVSAIFVKKTHAVTVEIQGETAGGAVSINKTSPVTVGEEVQVTVDTNAHYVLASLTMNGSPITDYKFTMPNEAVTIKAVFEKTKHALHYVESQNGTIQEITASDALPWGTVLHFTVTPNSYYVIDHVAAIINGVSTRIPPEAEGKYTYTTTPADTTIKAFYKKQQFTVKASATTNGTITLGEPATLDWDDNFTINVKADPNYEIDTVTVDGENVSVNNRGDYTFVMPKHDVTVSATFKKIKYTITGEGNNVTFGIPDKSTYNWGDTVEITATPDKWYNIKNVYAKTGTTEITKVSGKEKTYSFTMPASDITIVAKAERPNFTVTFNSQGGSSITPAIVANGEALTKPAAPSWAGRGFAGWYTDAACTQKYDFTKPVIRDLTLYARWFLWGDVNSDGKADTYDALLIRRCRVGLSDYSLMTNRMAGLVNGVGNRAPDTMDALSIQRCRTGLISRYAVEDSAAGYEFDLENNTYIAKS